MSSIEVTVEHVDKQIVKATITTPEGFGLSKNTIRQLVSAELKIIDAEKFTDAWKNLDWGSSRRPGKGWTRHVVLNWHDPRDDLFQKQPDGSYTMSFAALKGLGKKK